MATKENEDPKCQNSELHGGTEFFEPRVGSRRLLFRHRRGSNWIELLTGTASGKEVSMVAVGVFVHFVLLPVVSSTLLLACTYSS